MTFGEAAEVRFPRVVTAICLVYFGLQLAYVMRLPLVMDEFESAATVIDLTERFPYRDFPPYKTVLGHYLQLPAMLLGGPPWRSLMLVKLQMAVINTTALIAGAFVLRRFFSPAAVVLGLALTVLMSNFLERSSEIRVDMLTAWAGFASLLLLLGRRWAAAGLLAGVSFLISQKGIYFSLAGGLSTLVATFAGDQKRRFDMRPPMRFGGAAFGALLAYLLFWSALTSWGAVYFATFVRPQRIAFQTLYDDIRLTYWLQTIERNAGFYAFALVALLQLALQGSKSLAPLRDRMLLVYGTALLALSIWHRQPWPYFFVLVVPSLSVLCISFFDRLFRSASDRPRLLGMPRMVASVYILVGVAIPMVRVPVNLMRDNSFQKEMVTLAYCSLEPGEGYIAGMDMVYARRQPIGHLRWIDRPRAELLRQMNPTDLSAITDSLTNAPVKLWIENYRTQGLPPALRTYIEREYTPMWGNILIYGPEIPPGNAEVFLRFGGRYSVSTSDHGPAAIDGRSAPDGTTLQLNGGSHQIETAAGARLRLTVPVCESSADPRHREPADLFPDVYVY